MADIHIVLQGKGGVGKSVVSSLITQQQLEVKKSVLPIDTDPVNATFSGYEALKAKYIDIMDGDDINPRKFDKLMEMILETESECVVIDNGAASFVALASYMKSNQAIDMLDSMGHKVFIHTLITGGQAQKDTILGFRSIAQNFGETKAQIVVWLNEFWGVIEAEGKSFEDMKVFKDNSKSVHSIITIPELKQETFGEDMREMLTAKMTFNEAINGKKFQVMAKQRLTMIKRDLFANMSVAI